MDVHGCFQLAGDFHLLGIHEDQPAAVIAAAQHRPFAVRRELDVFHEALEATAVLDDLERLAFFPVKDFEPAGSPKVIDVADLLNTAGVELFAVRRKTQAAQAPNRMPAGARIPSVMAGRIKGFHGLKGLGLANDHVAQLIAGGEQLAIGREARAE